MTSVSALFFPTSYSYKSGVTAPFPVIKEQVRERKENTMISYGIYTKKITTFLNFQICDVASLLKMLK
jgi:hypothetical protein